MVSSTFDPNSFKMAQREGWDSVAGGWKEWWLPIEKGAQKLSQRLIELAEIKPGQSARYSNRHWRTINYSSKK